jgi:hypothetical protein
MTIVGEEGTKKKSEEEFRGPELERRGVPRED